MAIHGGRAPNRRAVAANRRGEETEEFNNCTSFQTDGPKSVRHFFNVTRMGFYLYRYHLIVEIGALKLQWSAKPSELKIGSYI